MVALVHYEILVQSASHLSFSGYLIINDLLSVDGHFSDGAHGDTTLAQANLSYRTPYLPPNQPFP